MKFYIFITALFLINYVSTSHFRGGIITWKPVLQNESMIVVNMTIKLGWRRGGVALCSQSSVLTGDLPIGDAGLNTLPGSLTGTFNGVYCTDFSETEDWSYGQRTMSVIYRPPYTRNNKIVYSGNAWIGLLNGGSNWYLSTTVNLQLQNHTNKVNQSPLTSMSPLIRIQAGCYAEVRIPVEDADGDVIKCRWAVGLECGDSCNLATNVALDSKNCLLKFNLTRSIGFYAIKLQIEDFATSNATEAISSIPLQFLVQAYASTQPCSREKPFFVDPTKKDKHCVGIPSATIYNDIIVAGSNDRLAQVSEIQTVSPPGMIKSQLNSIANSTLKYVNVTWNPSSIGVSIFCFTAVTSSYLTSEQRCISLAAGYNEPVHIDESMNPRNQVSPNQTEWSILSDKNITRPRFPAYIRFINNVTGFEAYKIDVSSSEHINITGNNLTFHTDQFLEVNNSYYITFDYGVLTSNEACGVNGREINSREFWSFLALDKRTNNAQSIKGSSKTGIIVGSIVGSLAALAILIILIIVLLKNKKKNKVEDENK